MLKGYVSNLTRATLIPLSLLPAPIIFPAISLPSVCLPVCLGACVRQLINSPEERGGVRERGNTRGEWINHLFIHSQVNKKTWPCSEIHRSSLWQPQMLCINVFLASALCFKKCFYLQTPGMTLISAALASLREGFCAYALRVSSNSKTHL